MNIGAWKVNETCNDQQWQECCSKNFNSHRVVFPCPSLHLKESFIGAFFLALGGLELDDRLFSIEGMVDARHGRQLFGRIPQLSKSPSSLLELASTEEISSRNTGSFTSTILPSHLLWGSTASAPEYWTSELLAASEIFAEYPADKSLGFCTGSVETPWLASLEDVKPDADPPSIPFRDNTSAYINCI